MKNLIAILLTALLGGATTTFSQTFVEYEEEWNCIELEFDVEANLIGDVYPFAKMIETPYGVLIYGRFSEIDGSQVTNIALYKDYGVEDAGIDIGGDIMQVLVNGSEVVFITTTGLFTWDGTSITDWGLNIQMFPGYENYWTIETEIIGDNIIISGFIETVNGENYNTVILDKNTKIVEHKILLPGNCRGFGKIGETYYFGYEYWPWSNPESYGYQPIISFNTGSLLMSYEQVGIPSPYITEITEYQGKIYALINRYPAQEEMIIFDGISWDFTGYYGFGEFIKKDSDLYLSGGIQFNTPEEPYNGDNGLLKYNSSEWEVMVDKNMKSVAANTWANGTWYAVEEFGSVNYHTDYGNGEETDFLCLSGSESSIAKLGEPDEEVSVTENISNFELYLSGESLIVNSKESFLIQIYNISGQKVLEEEVFPGTETFYFDQPPGIYLAKNKRFVKI